MKKISFWSFGILCVLIGLYPISYFVFQREFGLLSTKSPDLLSDLIWNIGFYGHIIFGGIALLVGWLQFNKPFRTKNINAHRTIGKIYVFSAIISGLCAIYIATHATGGIVTSLGFMGLGVIWLYSTISGFLAIKRKDISAHNRMMVYSYAACFSAVTLRIWMPIVIPIMGDFISGYKTVAWLSWVPNIIVAFFINTKKHR